ncbi:MAG: TylF/MycF family methyltransferase [Endomicrobium sp.]|nr:TylF/MycF family methyltransferase [Endomicrobium sp.]
MKPLIAKIVIYLHGAATRLLAKCKIAVIVLHNNNADLSPISTDHHPDLIRHAALCLCAEEIKRRGVLGNVAELGVYRGAFAAKINARFPDRTLYLFDTFEGFASKERAAAQSYGDLQAGAITEFDNTSVDLVLGKMPYPKQCVVKKGFFPDTAAGMEDEKFSFVSLDTDLYEPILNGLRWFYPRLEKGGYILIHDFNNNLYKGVKRAVLHFIDEMAWGGGGEFLPMPDAWGRAIICK